MKDRFDFSDLTPAQEPVTYKGEHFVVTEASEAAAVAYRNAVTRTHRYVDGKLSAIHDPADNEPLLVSKCLFKAVPGSPGQILFSDSGIPVAVERAKLDKFPTKIVRELFKWILEVSCMDDYTNDETLTNEIDRLVKIREERRAKNPSTPTAPTSGSPSAPGEPSENSLATASS